MKGKKFDAHEQHFKEKELKLNKEMNHIKEKCTEINNENIELIKENEKLKNDNLDIKAKYEKLMEYSKLSDEEIKEALQRDKSLNQLTTMINMMPMIL